MIHLFVLVFLVACEAFTLPSRCMNNANIPINCTIETGGADIQCPMENVIRVIGDYKNFSIHCQSYDPLEFKYDGTKPTEAIRINTWMDVTVGNESSRDPKVIRQHIKIEVLSVSSLIEEYKKTLKEQFSNLSVSPEIYYSRSGGFRFNARSIRFADYSLNFTFFFEEPQVDPAFINMYELNAGWRPITSQKYSVGCPSTHFVQPEGWGEPELWINAEKTTEDYEYDPTAGFTVFSPIQQIPQGVTFRCVIPHKTNLSKNVVFDPTLANSVYDLSLRELPLEESSEELLSYLLHPENFQVRCNPENSTLYFIAARNPDEQVLVRDFVLPDFVNRSLYLEIGKPSEDESNFNSGVQTYRGTSLHFGALYCAGAGGYNLRSFIHDRSSFLGLRHSVDWHRFQGADGDSSWPEDLLPPKRHREPFLELKNRNEGTSIYEFENWTLQCRVTRQGTGNWAPITTNATVLDAVYAQNISISNQSLWLDNDVVGGEDQPHLLDKGIGTKMSMWPGGVVPYAVGPDLESIHGIIKDVAKEFSHKTCIRFVPKTPSDEHYVQFIRNDSLCGKATACKAKGVQSIWIGKDCFNYETVLHELGHAICMSHEHQRPDRDHYITLKCAQYAQNNDTYSKLGLMYDYLSVMHPHNCNGTCLEPNHRNITNCGGRRLSVLDAEKINSLYNCGGCHGYRFRPSNWIRSEVFFPGVDQDGTGIGVCRAYVEGEIALGSFYGLRDDAVCRIPLQGVESFFDNFEVMTKVDDKLFGWYSMRKGEPIPHDSIPGGWTKDGEPQFIGRCNATHENNTFVIPGGIDHGRMHYSYWLAGYECEIFQVLRYLA